LVGDLVVGSFGGEVDVQLLEVAVGVGVVQFGGELEVVVDEEFV
jgi:hypothetical protein